MIDSSLTFIGGIGVQELILLFFFFVPAILWVWALIDCVTGTFSNSDSKLIWVVVIIFVPFLGSILYFIIGRSGRVRKE